MLLPASSPLAAPVTTRRDWLILVAVLGAVFAWLLYRNLGLNPAIFADEWYYSKMARLVPLSESILPSYLYLWIFSASSSCGTGFLDCVRIGNAILFVGAGPFIYLITRTVARPTMALAVTVFSLLGPVNLYTAFFMPEATYYAGFIVLSWVLLTRAGWGWAPMSVAAGLVLGMMSLVKVHAMFLLPAIALFLVCAGWLQARQPGSRHWLVTGLASAVLCVAVTLAVRFGLGFLLAGAPALSVFGDFYNNTASSSTTRSVFHLVAPGFINGRGHVMVLALLMPLPMALLLLSVVSRSTRREASAPFNRLALYTLLVLGSTVGMTVAYTASIAGVGPLEVIRLHLRYYSFTFPLLLALAAAIVGLPASMTARRARTVVALLVGAAVLAALVMIPRYAATDIDGPEIAAIHLASWTGWVIVALDLIVLALWARGSRWAGSAFLFVALPAMLVLGMHATGNYLRQLAPPGWPPDNAGKMARDTVPKNEHKLITIAADSVMDIMRAQFHIDDKDAGMLELVKGAPIEHYQLPARHKWLLVVGEHALPDGVEVVSKTNEYALVKLASDFQPIGSVELSKAYGAGSMLTQVDGLSVSEPWGRWSDAKQVVLHFDRPLPAQLDVILKGRAYADNTNLPFTMRVGSGDAAPSATFRLPASFQEVRLRFVTDGTQRTLTIDVPRPIAPSSLGEWPDNRELGIGIAEVSIGSSAAR